MEISVIVPVKNGGEDFTQCLEALSKSTRSPDEIIVVDDGSTDSTPRIASQFGAKVLSFENQSRGPAIARNRGAAIAQGNVLVFIDADVAVHHDTLARILEILAANPDISALFGSYDDAPPKRGLISRYKNLQHHFVHQHGRREAATFWAGCGAIRRDVFNNIGGFSERYPRPSIEDIELGLRLKKAGFRIWLCPEVLVTHLKQWRFFNLLRSDIKDRAIPWTRLILSTSFLPSDLNLDMKSRSSVIAVWAFLLSLLSGFIFPPVWIGAVVSLAAQVLLNLEFYKLIWQKEGLVYTLGSIVLHMFYYIYSSSTFGVLLVWHFLHTPLKSLAVLFLTKKISKRTSV